MVAYGAPVIAAFAVMLEMPLMLVNPMRMPSGSGWQSTAGALTEGGSRGMPSWRISPMAER